MAFELSLSKIEFPNSYRLLRRESIDTIVAVSRWILLGIVVVLLVVTARAFTDESHSPAVLLAPIEESLSHLASASQPAQRPVSVPADIALIESKNIFGPFAPKPTASTGNAPKPVSQIPLDLVGTFLTEGETPYAIIEDRNKKQQDVFVTGETIFNSAKLVGIFTDRVEIERGGQVEVLNLDVTGRKSAADAGGITSAGGDLFEIEEAELDRALANLPLLMTQARAVPYFKDGQSIGLRLFAIKAGSLFEKIGLKNGDILKSINGNNLGDLQQALKLFEELKSERSINVVLERNREDKQFQYRVQ